MRRVRSIKGKLQERSNVRGNIGFGEGNFHKLQKVTFLLSLMRESMCQIRQKIEGLYSAMKETAACRKPLSLMLTRLTPFQLSVNQ